MKKNLILSLMLCVGSLTLTEVMAQAPARQTAPSSSRTQTTSVSSQANRQMQRGDAQLNKANNSYQRAQSTAASRSNTTARQSSTSKPTTVSRQSSTSSTRPSASTAARPASNATARPSSAATTRPANTSSSGSSVSRTPASAGSSTARPASTPTSASRTGSVSTKPTTATPSSTATNARTSSGTATVSNKPAASSSVSSRGPAPTASATTDDATKRGYNDHGQARPQPAPQNYGHAGAPGHAPKPAPYMHPNHHNFGYHMVVPRHIRPVYYHGMPYYFYNSVFCRYINGYYIICRPPIGAVIAHTIFHTWRPVIVIHRNVTYYYDDGTFYVPRKNDYEVVAPPIGARVAELPSNYEEIVLDGNVYFKVDNVYYKEVVVSGYLWYEVVFVS